MSDNIAIQASYGEYAVKGNEYQSISRTRLHEVLQKGGMTAVEAIHADTLIHCFESVWPDDE